MPKTEYRMPVIVKFTEAWTTPEHHDKSDWGEGPWQDEPDKIVWVDLATGLDCMIHRNPIGALCGYVGVERSHPLYGRDYSEDWCHVDEDDNPIPPPPRTGPSVHDLEVHGGITYANSCQTGDADGFGICHIPQPGRSHDIWWLGFDCAHAFDLSPGMEARMRRARPHLPADIFPEPPEDSMWRDTYKTVAYVVNECASLAKQLAALA